MTYNYIKRTTHIKFVSKDGDEYILPIKKIELKKHIVSIVEKDYVEKDYDFTISNIPVTEETYNTVCQKMNDEFMIGNW